MARWPVDDLNTVLRRERELLDQLRFRYTETRLLLAAREVRYLRWATAEVEHARLRVRETDLLRAARLQRGDIRGASGSSPTLREVAAAADEPWSGILRDHHEGLCALVSEIELIGHRNAELAREGIRLLAERSGPSQLERWLAPTNDAEVGSDAGSVATVTVDIDAPPERVTHLVDETAYQDVIATASKLRMPALLAFLR